MGRVTVELPGPMQKEIGVLKCQKQELETEVETFLANVACEKNLQTDVAKAKADDVSRLKGLLAAAHKNADDATALFEKEAKAHVAAVVKAKADAQIWVKKELSEGVEKKAQQIITTLETESKRLDNLSVAKETTAGCTETKQSDTERAQADAEAKLVAARTEAETAGVGEPEALEKMRQKVAQALEKAKAMEAENLTLKVKTERVTQLEAEMKVLRQRIADAPKIDPEELQRLKEKKLRIDAVDVAEVEQLRELAAKLPGLLTQLTDLRKEAEVAANVDTSEIDALRKIVANGLDPVLDAPAEVVVVETKEVEDLRKIAAKLPAMEAEAASLKKKIEGKTAKNEAELEKLRTKARESAFVAASADAAAAAALAGPASDSPEFVALRAQAGMATELDSEIATLSVLGARIPGLELENQRLRLQAGVQ